MKTHVEITNIGWNHPIRKTADIIELKDGCLIFSKNGNSMFLDPTVSEVYKLKGGDIVVWL
jgi:hypothetical protein